MPLALRLRVFGFNDESNALDYGDLSTPTGNEGVWPVDIIDVVKESSGHSNQKTREARI